MMGIPRDHTTPYTVKDKCHECREPFKKRDTLKSGRVVELKLYDDPWATEPCTVRVHADNDDDGHGTCLDKLTDTSWRDFRYFDCPLCGRLIVGQHLDNGWRSFQKEYEGETVCVKCYQEILLSDGNDPADFERGRIPGDFFNASDLNANDWSLVPGMKGDYISGEESVKRFCHIALEKIKEGYKVLVDYNSMGIGGGEGYVSLYCKQ